MIAANKPIAQLTPDNPQRWQTYYYNNNIYSIQLKSLTKAETRSYLAQKGITDQDKIEAVWNLSDGLPLNLSLLTINPQGDVDPNSDVIVNFLSWMPEIKQKLIKDASLFSRPFDLFDLSVFTYLPEDKNELQSLYFWLIEQPFVRLLEGRHIYHELARELFSSHLYQYHQSEYYTTRRTLANFYWSLLKKAQEEWGKETPRSPRWLELTLALAVQLLYLPDEVDHIRGIEQILMASLLTEKRGETVRVLRELSHELSLIHTNSDAFQITEHLLRFTEADQKDQDFITAATYLLDKVVHEPSFPKVLLSIIYINRGNAYLARKEYEYAIKDFNRAADLTPDHSLIYLGRGLIYFELNKYQQVIEELDQGLRLGPKIALFYTLRGLSHLRLEDYQLTIDDMNQAIILQNGQASEQQFYNYYLRGNAYYKLGDYEHAAPDLYRAIELGYKSIDVYFKLGAIYIRLKNYQKAIQNFNHFLELDPKSFEAYLQRGIANSLLGDQDHALADFEHTLKLDPRNLYALSLLGETHRALGNYEDALTAFNRAIEIDESMINTLSTSRGLVLSYLGRYAEAIDSYECGLKQQPSSYQHMYNIAVAMVRWKGFPDAQMYVDNAHTRLENELKSEEKGAVLYGLGGLKALTGNVDQALIYLEKSVGLEEHVVEWSRHDIAWLDLRSNLRFQALVFETQKIK